jgi:hypothetical protein
MEPQFKDENPWTCAHTIYYVPISIAEVDCGRKPKLIAPKHPVMPRRSKIFLGGRVIKCAVGMTPRKREVSKCLNLRRFAVKVCPKAKRLGPT